jgi:hypothetical protein
MISTIALIALVIGELCVATTATAQDSKPATAPDNDYQLVSNGSEPRSVLRYSPKVGQSALLTWETTSQSTREENGVAMEPKPFPITLIRLTMEVVNVTEQEITQRIEFVDFETPETDKKDVVVEGMRANFAEMKGKHAEITIDRRGRFVRGGFDPSQYSTAQMQSNVQRTNQQLASMCMPLPVEAVGQGARWILERDIEGVALKSHVTVEYSLERIDDSAVTLAVRSKQIGVPKSPTSSIRESNTQTRGQLTLDLTDLSQMTSRLEPTMIISQDVRSTDPPTK